MKVASHFTLLLYPFRHDWAGGKSLSVAKELEPRWRPWWTRLDRTDLEVALDDTLFFVPHVRRMLFPETGLLSSGDAVEQVKQADLLARLPLTDFARQVESDGMVRLTCGPELVESLHPLRLSYERKSEKGEVREQFSAPARIHWIDAALFPQRVGFLLLKVECLAPDISPAMLSDFLYYARQVHQQNIRWVLPMWFRERPDATQAWRSRDLIDYLLQGFDGEPVPDRNLESFLDRMRRGEQIKRYSSTEPGQVYGQTFRHFTYACAEIQESAPQDAAPGAAFASAVDRTLYELATCTQVDDPTYLPHPKQVRELFRNGHVALWRNWEGLVIHDSAVFLASSVSNFTRHALAHNVEMDYFHLYLLTLYQKVRLGILSGELMRHGATLHADVKEARKLSDEFIMFRNHYWFPEVTFKPQGIELYRKYQAGLGIPTIYKAVRESVHELTGHFERKAEHLKDRLLVLFEVVAFIVLPAEILAQVFAEDLAAETRFGFPRLRGAASLYVLSATIAVWIGLVVSIFIVTKNWKRRG